MHAAPVLVEEARIDDLNRPVRAAERIGGVQRLAVALASALNERQRDVGLERRAEAHGGDVALAAAGLLRVGAGDEVRAAEDRLAVERLQPDELLAVRDR